MAEATKTAPAAKKKPPRVPPTPRPSSLASLEQRRKGFVARGPSGEWYRIRAVGIERHAFAGGMPPTLAAIVTEGEGAVGKLFEELAQPSDTTEQAEAKRGVVNYLDQLVLATVMEPRLTQEHLGDPMQLDDDPLLPPLDYMWLVSVGMRATEFDAEGRRLFGFDPEMQLATFRAYHECPDDCEHCAEVVALLSEYAKA